MRMQTITTLYDWEAERVADEFFPGRGNKIVVSGNTVTVRGLSWTIRAQHIRGLCFVSKIAHVALDGVPVVWTTDS